MSRTESVDEWTEILVNLVDAGKIHLSPGDDMRREAWRLAQQDDELTHLRALAAGYGVGELASQEKPVDDREIIQRAFYEAVGIHGAALALAALPHAQRYEPLENQLRYITASAQAIVDQLSKLR